jgi:hypothetical protein
MQTNDRLTVALIDVMHAKSRRVAEVRLEGKRTVEVSSAGIIKSSGIGDDRLRVLQCADCVLRPT